jgi:predicted NodU family carbamoyl transferase
VRVPSEHPHSIQSTQSTQSTSTQSTSTHSTPLARVQTVTEEQEPWLCTILRWISRWKGPPAVVRPSSAPDQREPAEPRAALSGGFAQIVNTSFNDRGKPILRAAPAPSRPSLALRSEYG